MSDFEGRVTEVLRAESESAPDALGLADAARSRARARRRTRLAAVGLTAVAALAVPVGIVTLGGDGGDGEPPQADDPTAPANPTSDAGRWETWHGVTVQVPDDWQYGDQSTWCANGGSADEFRITRPGGVSEMIACTPASSYGLSFQEIEMEESEEPFDWPVVTQTGDAWPLDTYVGAHAEDGVLITVAGPDRKQLLDILATASAVDPVDGYGCSTTDDGGPGMAGANEVPVCRYDDQGRLVQSEKLTGEDAAAATEAVVMSEVVVGGGRDCKNGPTEYVVMGVERKRVEVQYAGNSLCVDRGVFVDGVRHQMTSDVLYWALSPGWTGAVGEAVPLPTPLRNYDPAA